MIIALNKQLNFMIHMKVLFFKINSIIALFSLISCNSNTDSEANKNNGDSTEKETVNIEQAIFTDPKLTSTRLRDYAILNSLVDYTKNTLEDETIHISTMLFYYEPLVEATVKALERGVIVKALFDGREGNIHRNLPAYNKLKNAMKDPSSLKWVYNDSKGGVYGASSAINHEKFMLFSKVDLKEGWAKNLVFATSHNFKASGAEQVNNAIVMTDKGLYDAFVGNWNAIESRASSEMSDFNYSFAKLGNGITAYFYPRRKGGEWDRENTVVEHLEEKGSQMDTIRVLMAGWSGNGLRIAEKLTDLESEGVIVQVITRNDIRADVLKELSKLKSNNGYLKIINLETQGLHSKTMMMKGKEQNIVLTGSYNYSSSALKYNNEFLIMLENSKLFNAYWNNWEEVDTEF